MSEYMCVFPLHLIMEPGVIAFFGASNNPMTMGTSMLLNTMKYNGTVFPIHPKEKSVLGLRTYSSVSELPEIPDLAIFVIPKRIIIEKLEECGKYGIKRAIIVTGGFREAGNEDEERELVKTAKKYGIRFLGPNTLGVYNAYNNMNTMWFPSSLKKGGIGLIAQSGTISNHTFPTIRRMGCGISKIISVGNGVDIDIVDCLEYLGRDENTRTIALYTEGLSRFRDFLKVAKNISKPMVALYVGGTDAGARSGMAHTGALAGRDEIYDGMFRQVGIIRARTTEELFDWSLALSIQPKLKGRKIGVFTDSGGTGACMADCASRVNLEVPVLGKEVQKELQSHVSGVGSTNNPIDLTFDPDPDKFYKTIPEIVLKEVDGLLIYGIFGLEHFEGKIDKGSMEKMRESMLSYPLMLKKVSDRHGKPIIASSFFTRDEDSMVAMCQDVGIPVYPSPERAVCAMRALYEG